MPQGARTRNRSATAKRANRRRRARGRRTGPYRWLGAGAVALGLGAAIASGSGIAYADETAVGASPSTDSAENKAADAKSPSTADRTANGDPTAAGNVPSEPNAAVSPSSGTAPTSTVASSGGNLSARSESPEEGSHAVTDPPELTEEELVFTEDESAAAVVVDDPSPDPQVATEEPTRLPLGGDDTAVEVQDDSKPQRDNDSFALETAESPAYSPSNLVDREIDEPVPTPPTGAVPVYRPAVMPASAAATGVEATATTNASIATVKETPSATSQNLALHLLRLLGLSSHISANPGAPVALNLLGALFIEARRLSFDQSSTTTAAVPVAEADLYDGATGLSADEPVPPTLSLASFAAAVVDPYIQQFLDADPTGQFFTPASTDWSYWLGTVGTFFDPITFEEGLALYGTEGFSRDAQGTLRYTNNFPFDVAVLHASDGHSPVEGIVVARPGQTVIVRNTYALAQAPRIYAPTGRPLAIVAIAGPGAPAAAGPADLPSFLVGVLWDTGQKIFDSVVRNTQAAIANLMSFNLVGSVMNGFQILVDVGAAMVDAVARGVQGTFARLFGV